MNSISVAVETPSSYKSSQLKKDPELFNLDLTTKPERYLDKMKIDKGKVSPGGGSITSANAIKQNTGSSQSSKKLSNKNSISPSSHSIDYKTASLSKSNLDRHQKETSERTTSTSHHRKKPSNATSDIEYDNGNTSPLYSNWDQEMQEHLLPLQHYIIEQAKLSGCYGLGGDQLDSDSLNSDNQSEHSFAGHEPDNEDSDHSDDRGDYLAHNYVIDDEYGVHRGGVSYYNLDLNFDKDKEDM